MLHNFLWFSVIPGVTVTHTEIRLPQEQSSDCHSFSSFPHKLLYIPKLMSPVRMTYKHPERCLLKSRKQCFLHKCYIDRLPRAFPPQGRIYSPWSPETFVSGLTTENALTAEFFPGNTAPADAGFSFIQMTAILLHTHLLNILIVPPDCNLWGREITVH